MEGHDIGWPSSGSSVVGSSHSRIEMGGCGRNLERRGSDEKGRMKRYVLRLFMSLKYITANVVDRNNGRIVVSASTVEHALKASMECGRTCNAKAAAAVGEVLAMRLKVEGLSHPIPIHANVQKEIEKKGFKNRTKVWAVVNALKSNGVNLVNNDDDHHHHHHHDNDDYRHHSR